MSKRRNPSQLIKHQQLAVNQGGKPVTQTVVKTVRTVPSTITTHYSDALIVQLRDAMFIISFLQNQYPLLTEESDIKKLKEIEQRCVAQVVVSPHQMAKNLRALNQNFNSFIELQDEEGQKLLKDILEGKTPDDGVR